MNYRFIALMDNDLPLYVELARRAEQAEVTLQQTEATLKQTEALLEQERQRSQNLEARLRALGVDPEQL